MGVVYLNKIKNNKQESNHHRSRRLSQGNPYMNHVGKAQQAKPPEKGAFPLDRDHACDEGKVAIRLDPDSSQQF